MTHFSADFFSTNRARLCELLPNSLICIPAHAALQSSGDTSFPFRQDSNFWYLTGINEPDLVLIINTQKCESQLLVLGKNDYQKEWDGEHNQEYYKKCSAIESVVNRKYLGKIIKATIKNGMQICYLQPSSDRIEPFGFYANPARALFAQELNKLGVNPKDIRREMASLRQIKQPNELDAIREAIKITGQTLADIRQRQFTLEKDIERAISSGFFAYGGDGHAFQPIVASGSNASSIHYIENNDLLPKSGMLLLDIGAIKDGYCADISRTWGIGVVSQRHRDLYNAVLEVQDFAFSSLRSGVLIKEYQQAVEKKVQSIFKSLNCSAADKPFPHGFSHFMGIDVHDAGLYDEPLVENSVLTVEPGIYLSDEGIGIRIEDDVLITSNGIEILSSSIPRGLEL